MPGMDESPFRNDPPPRHDPPFGYRPQTAPGQTPPPAPQPANPYSYPYPSQPYAAAAPTAQSGPGIASVIVAAVSIVGYVGAFGYLVVIAAENPGVTPDPQDPRLVASGCGLILTGLLNLVGLALGFIGVFQKDRRRGMAIAGLLLNGLPVLCVGALIVIGIIAQRMGIQ